MLRYLAAVAVVVCVSPSWLFAQTTEFTIKSASADVHKSPSTGSPVIGTAPRGTVLKVTRELGSWVRISWPAAQDGIGFVHVNMGSIANSSVAASRPAARPTTTANTGARTPTATTTPARPAPPIQPAATTVPQGERIGAVRPPSPVPSVPIPHRVGLGGRMGGSTAGFGASVRAQASRRFRVQLEVSRYSHTNLVTERLTSVQFAPSVLYSLPDKVTDYVWVRPYVGGGVGMYRSTLSTGASGAGASVADSTLGRQVFGGVEVAVANMPRFTLSADYGYRSPQTPFTGFELGGRGLSISGHWYVK